MNRLVLPKPPKGLSFEIADHQYARHWAASHKFRMGIDLEYGIEGEEYEEVLAFQADDPSRRQWRVWQELECIVVQPIPGRATRYASLQAALRSLVPLRR